MLELFLRPFLRYPVGVLPVYVEPMLTEQWGAA